MDRVIRPALLLFIALIHTAPTFCQVTSRSEYEMCGEFFSCGVIGNIGYPFWGGSQPAYCGHPDFELSCLNDSPEISIQSLQYKVFSIDFQNQTVTIARADLLRNMCPSNPQNTTLDFDLFDYSSPDNLNMTIFYSCANTNTLSAPLNLYFFNCSNGNSELNRRSAWSPGTELLDNLDLCRTRIVVPVTRRDLEFLTNALSVLNTSLVSTELLSTAVGSGFSVQLKANNTLCEECRRSGGRCGSNGNSTEFVCHSDSDNKESKGGLRNPVKLGLVSTFSLLGLALFSTLIVCYFKRRPFSFGEKGDERVQNIEAFIRTDGLHAPKLYTYSEIKKMTNSFKDKVGEGGFGSVYKGKLPNGCPVAVKLLTNTKGNGEDFINEVASISRTSHVNVVSLLGFSYQKIRALVYEFMPNGSLDKFICNKGSLDMSCQLEWTTLYQIATGIARGLEYLHRGCNTRIMHLDIKPNNILLDMDFTPKISDFGLAKLCKKKGSIQSLSMFGARGTIGYIAPEVFFRSFGGVSHKSDVYSYGMTVIDMVGVREKVVDTGDQATSESYFPDWIYDQLEQGVDFRLQGITNEDDKEMAMKLIMVGLWCIQTNPLDRPSIRRVVEMLEGSIDSLQIPPKPFFYPPTELLRQCSSSSFATEI